MKKLIILFLILIPGHIFANTDPSIKDQEGSIYFHAFAGFGQYLLSPDYNWDSFLEYDKSFTSLYYGSFEAGYKFIPLGKLRIETSESMDSDRDWLEKSGEDNFNIESYKFSLSPALITEFFPTDNKFLKAFFFLTYRETKEVSTGSFKAKDDFIYLDENRNRTLFLKDSHAGFKNEYSLKEYLVLSSPDIRDIRVGFGYYELKRERVSRMDQWYNLPSETIGKTEYESKGLMLELYSGEEKTGPYTHLYVRYGFDNDIKTPFGDYEDRFDDQSATGFINYGGEIGYKYSFVNFKRLNLFMDINFSYSRTEWTVLEMNYDGNYEEDEVLEEDKVYKGFFSIGAGFL